MPDFKVTFKGDLGNLRQFDAAIRNSAVESARQIENAHKKAVSTVGKVTGPLQATSGAGLFTNKQRTELDAYNRTFKHTGELIRQTIKDYEVLKDAQGNFSLSPVISQDYMGQYTQIIGDMDRYEKALKRVSKTEKQVMDIRLNTRTKQLEIDQRISGLQNQKGGSAAQLKALVQDAPEFALLENARTQLAKVSNPDAYMVGDKVFNRREIENKIIQLQNSKFGGSETMWTDPAKLQAVDAEIESLRKTLSTPQQGQLSTLVNMYTQQVQQLESALLGVGEPLKQEIAQIDAEIAKLQRQRLTVERSGTRRESSARRSNPAYAELEAARTAIPPIQRDLNTVLTQSKDLRKNLLAGGLGQGAKYGSAEFVENLAKQEAAVSRYSQNLRTNVRTVQGTFRDLNTGLLKDFSVDLDENGKVVGRWGGQLRGAGTFLKQTVRDFQKVIEWTVATTFVFGALATVVTQLQGINELNTSLARFAITANLTSEETNGLFKELSNVAYNTATPLKDLVKVADDIALATREANQSTAEWHNSILDLTNAVGIFTNLTGKDTVQSADLLSAAFKQLDIAPDQLIGVLNKVTAVAGGQANAIADILQSIGGLAEAAKAAGFTIDEQIAAVQVLAQVTNKTSDEIATSFKNLFGSISSVGSVKILKQFGIEVRDETGGIKDFLDIYREVKEAVESGIIPQNRLPDVLRGISGGPRRAPDAAALLANLGRIDEVIGKSLGATNEALIANAKVLDTNQARIVQFQNAFDTAVFERFGAAVENLTQTLTEFGISFFGVFNKIPSELLTLGVQFAALVIGSKLLGGALKTAVIPSLKNMTTSIKGAVAATKELITNQQNYRIHAVERQGRAQYQLMAGSRNIIGPDGKLYKPGSLLPENLARQYGVGPSARATHGLLGTSSRNFNVFGRNIQATYPSQIGRRGLLGAGLVGGGAAALYGAAQLKSGNAEINPRDLGSILQVGGGLATLLPGLGTAFGVTAIAIGTALQFIAGESEKVVKSSAELNAEIYDLTKTLQTSQTEANGYAETQKKLGDEIAELNKKSKLTSDEQQRLNSLAAEYATATLALATANNAVSQTFDDLLQKIPDLADKYSGLVTSIRSGGLDANSPAVKELSQKLAGDILRASGQIIYSGDFVPVGATYNRNTDTSRMAVTTAEYRRAGNRAETFDLKNLVDTPQDLLKLFNLDTGQANFQIPQNELSLGYLQSALAQLPALMESGAIDITDAQLENLANAITKMTAEVSSAAANLAASNQLRARAQSNAAIGAFSSEQLANSLFGANLLEAIAKAQGQIKPNAGFSPDIRDTPSALGTGLQDIAGRVQRLGEAGQALPNYELIELAKLVFQAEGSLSGLERAGDAALNQGIYQWAQSAGVSTEQLDSLIKILHIDLAALPTTLDEINARLEVARSNAGKAFADRSLQLLIAENSGQYEDNAKGLAILKEQNQQAYDSTLALADSINQLSSTSFVALAESLSKVTGLQYLQNLSAEELQEAQTTLGNELIENAVKAGVNAEGIKKITAEVARLIGVMEAIPPYKQTIIEVKTLYSEGGRTGVRGAKDAVSQKRLVDALKEQQKQIRAGKDPSSQINKILNDINKILSQGSGGNLGSKAAKAAKAAGGASTPYNKPGLLDIPDEILEQTNYRDLVKKAIATAKGLQASIPGEAKQNKNDIVELLNGTKRVFETRGIGEEYLRRALDELTDQIKRNNDLLAKADTIRRIRVNTPGFAALANVPLNSQSGVSLGGPQGPINISLNMNGTVLTPAQFQQFANMVGASIKRQLTA